MTSLFFTLAGALPGLLGTRVCVNIELLEARKHLVSAVGTCWQEHPVSEGGDTSRNIQMADGESDG